MSDSRIMEPSTELRSGLLLFGSLVPGPEPNGELGSCGLVSGPHCDINSPAESLCIYLIFQDMLVDVTPACRVPLITARARGSCKQGKAKGSRVSHGGFYDYETPGSVVEAAMASHNHSFLL